MRGNYCSVDLHRSEREVIVVNKKKPNQEMFQRMPLSPEWSRVYSAFESIVIF